MSFEMGAMRAVWRVGIGECMREVRKKKIRINGRVMSESVERVLRKKKMMRKGLGLVHNSESNYYSLSINLCKNEAPLNSVPPLI